MSTLALIVLARAIHVIAGVAWAGATFVLATVVVPMGNRYSAEGAGRWTGMIAGKVGPMSGIAALLTVASGVYLFAVLHPQDSSASGLVLKCGAAAALLSLAIGFLLGRPTGIALGRLNEQRATTAAPAADLLERMAKLRRRAALSSRLAAALLGVAVLSMAVFRYAQAIA